MIGTLFDFHAQRGALTLRHAQGGARGSGRYFRFRAWVFFCKRLGQTGQHFGREPIADGVGRHTQLFGDGLNIL
ncbi:MAG: hypothetical protein A3K41_07855 [Chloroflexi bacterium RIFOXYD12_FULL_57_15]|nr:MAG: hypothetical protein A3K41_07855 [Chloroflexi bacterium RIFOXYD12_FULL_57_15]